VILRLIVLGIIPGTNIQLNFRMIAIGLCLLILGIEAFRFRRFLTWDRQDTLSVELELFE
jgi:hypothetical protein